MVLRAERYTPTMVEVSGIARSGLRVRDPRLKLTYTRSGCLSSAATTIQSQDAEACTCKNLEYWADPGHLGLLCLGDCGAAKFVTRASLAVLTVWEGERL